MGQRTNAFQLLNYWDRETFIPSVTVDEDKEKVLKELPENTNPREMKHSE